MTAHPPGGERQTRNIGAPTARSAQRISGSAEPPEPMTDEALAEAAAWR